MTTALRAKENNRDFPLFKTPLRTPRQTPIHNRMLSSVTMNDLAHYSNNAKNLKFAGTSSMNDLQSCNDMIKTPIRLNKLKLSTPGSIQRRRALGLVNNNNPNPICHTSLSDDPAGLMSFKELNFKREEPISLLAQSPKAICSHPEDDLPHKSANSHIYEDKFDDLIPNDERIERMITKQTSGINLFGFNSGLENTIRSQSPFSSRIDVSCLLDILN